MLDQPTLASLFQFGALALPAVAIMMQVTLEIADPDEYQDPTEIPGVNALRWSFTLLIFSVLIFAFELLANSESFAVQVGILVTMLAFVSLISGLLQAFVPEAVPFSEIPSEIVSMLPDFESYSDRLSKTYKRRSKYGKYVILFSITVLEALIAVFPAITVVFMIIIFSGFYQVNRSGCQNRVSCLSHSILHSSSEFRVRFQFLKRSWINDAPWARSLRVSATRTAGTRGRRPRVTAHLY